MALDIRPWKPGDEAAILNLFQVSFGRKMEEAFWRWRYQEHPAGDPLAMLAWDGDRLAAHYAASHAPLHIGGESVPAALSMTTMTAPAYRGQGLMEKTAVALYEEMIAIGIVAVWGFPNIISNVTFQKKLGWTSIADVATMRLALAGRRPADARGIEVVDAIDARFADLSARVAKTAPIRAARSLDILRWRIDRNPSNRYVRLALPDGDGIAAYAILKSYGEDALDLVEFCAEGDDAARLMLSAVEDHAHNEGRCNVNTWCMNRDANRLTFERAGYAATAPVTYFGGRPFSDFGRDMSDPRLWRLSMLDSDLY